MASVTPAAGETMRALSGSTTTQSIVAKNPMPAQAERLGVERIGPVRILRAGAGWRGVALRLTNASNGDEKADERFELALTAGDGRSITVAVADSDDAVALWRDCGRTSGLSLLLETDDGVISEPYPQVGRLALGPIRIRRRYSVLNGRRPRFLTRRKTGKLGDRPVVVSGERFTD
jgi:hypothetical protein